MHKTSLRIRQRVTDALGIDQPSHTQPLQIQPDTFDNVQVRKNAQDIRLSLYSGVLDVKDVRAQKAANMLSGYAGRKMTPIELAARVIWALSTTGALQPGQLNNHQSRKKVWGGISKALIEDAEFHQPFIECLEQSALFFASQTRE